MFPEGCNISRVYSSPRIRNQGCHDLLTHWCVRRSWHGSRRNTSKHIIGVCPSTLKDGANARVPLRSHTLVLRPPRVCDDRPSVPLRSHTLVLRRLILGGDHQHLWPPSVNTNRCPLALARQRASACCTGVQTPPPPLRGGAPAAPTRERSEPIVATFTVHTRFRSMTPLRKVLRRSNIRSSTPWRLRAAPLRGCADRQVQLRCLPVTPSIGPVLQNGAIKHRMLRPTALHTR